MRRLLLSMAASALVVALLPASALARNDHHKWHHSRHHHARVHKSKIRHKRFGNVTTPSATTPAPNTPGAPPADAVGKVATFDGKTLVIALNDGTTVSGKLMPDTKIECESMQNESSRASHHGEGDRGEQGVSGGDDKRGGDDNGRHEQGANSSNQCTTANLTPGTFIRGAELGISSAGAVWEKVDLIL
jgi:hypothetical protein